MYKVTFPVWFSVRMFSRFLAFYGLTGRIVVTPCSNMQAVLTEMGRKIDMAEREGFEPPVPFQVQQFSRLPVSTAHTPLRMSRVFPTSLYDGSRPGVCVNNA
jgi:hypothetical protein